MALDIGGGGQSPFEYMDEWEKTRWQQELKRKEQQKVQRARPATSRVGIGATVGFETQPQRPTLNAHDSWTEFIASIHNVGGVDAFNTNVARTSKTWRATLGSLPNPALVVDLSRFSASPSNSIKAQETLNNAWHAYRGTMAPENSVKTDWFMARGQALPNGTDPVARMVQNEWDMIRGDARAWGQGDEILKRIGAGITDSKTMGAKIAGLFNPMLDFPEDINMVVSNREILEGRSYVPTIYDISRSASLWSMATAYPTVVLFPDLEKLAEVRGQGTEKVASEANPKSQIIKSQISNPQSLIPNPSLSTIHYPLFTIKTPTATVTDLGTEFGVEVQPSGLTSAYVFQGVVEMQSNDKGSSRVRLTAQEAGQVDGGDAGVGTVVRRIKIDPALFVRSEQLQKQANTAEDDRQMASFHRWQAYSRKLRRVSSLVAYYDFQQQKNKPTLLVNVAERTQGSCDGVVDGAAWCNGRMPGKQALWFQKPTDHVRIDLPQKLNDLTLTAWLSFDMLEAGGQRISGLVMSDDTRLHWQVGNWDGHLCLYAGDRDNAEGWQVVQPYQYHQWMHLACTYDHVTGNVAFYCNGRFAGARTWPAGEPIVIGPAWIGGWKNATRNFQGRIDELAIFSRSLSVQEVLQMYRNGKP